MLIWAIFSILIQELFQEAFHERFEARYSFELIEKIAAFVADKKFRDYNELAEEVFKNRAMVIFENWIATLI